MQLRSRIACLAAAAALGPIVLYPHLGLVDEKVALRVETLLRAVEVRYVPSHQADSVRLNGLPLYLVQTSVTPPIPRATAQEALEFARLSVERKTEPRRPSNVIVVECEGWWHDDAHFADAFKPLRALGLRQFRAISPAYGGGTVNASFEMLTGLPARGPLTGIIFQEYADKVHQDSDTVARYLGKQGYRTIAIHPYKRRFWHRDVVLPKLGFQQFLSIEDMNYKGPLHWADDAILYETALRVLAEQPAKNFLYLTTVYTHGDFKRQSGDTGESDYLARLSLSVDRLAAFLRALPEVAPDSLVLVMPDHKPALTKYFVTQGIIPESEFAWTGDRVAYDRYQLGLDASQETLGDVPVYVSYRDKAREDEFAQRADGKPFFCMSELLDEVFLHSGLPAFEYAREKGLCSSFRPPTYKELVAKYPEWLYALSLFADRQPKAAE